ncbi:MAG: PilZ domain-containing protein [Desulfobacterales bacterium]|nr:PilZ domain-containing protein [Deltaproteobacteria bacterium]MBT8361333.1 PilZ domain-containing protein [Deltaproteobacteria bacterium]NNK95945.1 PilZ domain-containing protein [Desulfobacterales bacterium]
MDKTVDRRVSFRIPFASSAVCHVVGADQEYGGTLRDISITSLFLETDDCREVGNICDLDIVLEGKHSRLVIENVNGRIIRRDDTGVAISFDEHLEWFNLMPLYFHKMRDQSQK